MANKKPTELLKDKAVGAMLGAACGDALGWPNERIGRSKSKKQPQGQLPEFRKWTRQAGGRFYPHEEVIEAGEYSDDTQLILCLCRSLQRGPDWWHYWTEVEIPFWILYERGGGGATKRAADAWIDGKAPWSTGRNSKDIKKYFDAGGNGVAMRVLPHVLYLASSEDFNLVAKNIVLDGIVTHGHPRALVGALAYGYALWKSIRRESRLEYGEIAADLLNNIKVWASLPDMPKENSGWLQKANHFQSSYHQVWDTTVQEMESLLCICRNELEKGALTIDDEALCALRCFDRKVSGAGTIAATAAVFLASRYAPDPIHGIAKAAFAFGSDTDTIASMTGGLLGMVSGSTWLLPLKDEVQDSSYLVKMAECVLDQKLQELQAKSMPGIRRSALKDWGEQLVVQTTSDNVILPDGQKGTVYFTPDQIGKSGRFKVQFRKVACEDGQSLFFKKISRGEFQAALTSSQKRFVEKNAQLKMQDMSFGPKLPVESFEKAVWFYRDLLGLSIKKKLQETIVFDHGLVLVPKSYCDKQLKGVQLRTMLYIEIAEIEKRLALVKDSGLEIITPIGRWGKSLRFFRCADPDGNIVEVFAATWSS